MMPKPSKVIKKGYDPPGTSYIALGSKKESTIPTNSNISAAAAAASLSLQSDTAASATAAAIGAAGATGTMARSSSSSLLTQTTAASKQLAAAAAAAVSSGSSTSTASAIQFQTTAAAAVVNTAQYYLDPKTIKEEVIKLADKEGDDVEITEKLVKITRSLVMNIKAIMLNSNANILTNSLNKPSPQQQKQGTSSPLVDSNDLHTMVHNYLNYVVSLSYIALKRPQLFINENLTEFLCTHFLFSSSKSDKQFSNGSGGGLGLSSLGTKAKSIHSQLSTVKGAGLTTAVGSGASNQAGSTSPPPPNMVNDVLAAICELFMLIYDGEDTWPEVFVRAYLDDSVGERFWVDAPACRTFADNVRTAFATKSIPQQQQSSTSTTTIITTDNNGDATKNLLYDDDQPRVLNRYTSNKEQVKSLTLDFIKSHMNVPSKTGSNAASATSITSSSSIKRTVTGAPTSASTAAASAAATAAIDNKNFIRLMQHICGLDHELRARALTRLDAWLLNPKLESAALDLLMALCCNLNCSSSSSSTSTTTSSSSPDIALVQHIIRIKPKLKQQQHYFDCIRELAKQSPQNLEALIQLSVRNELLAQQQASAQQQQQTPQSQKSLHCLNLLQAAFSIDGKRTSKILAQTFQKMLIQRNGDEMHLRAMRILLRDIIRNNNNTTTTMTTTSTNTMNSSSRVGGGGGGEQCFDAREFTSELINDQLICDLFMNTSDTVNHHHHQQQQQLFMLGNLDQQQQQQQQQPLCDFVGQTSVRERYAHAICDLITVCVLVSITPAIKEAYQRMGRSADALPDAAKECLIRYYTLMSQIQSDSVAWLQKTVARNYKINTTELIKCLFKVLFMVEKPEQHYTIESWPSEQERGILFRVVSEIPVLSDTLHQVLMLTKSLPESMYMLMLCVEENLLKTCALVHCKHIYSLRMRDSDTFVQLLFNICLYRPQPTLAVSVLYWRAWQCLLILTAVEPGQLGEAAWEHYPTLRLLMEMIMIDDYSFPPQSSLSSDGVDSADMFRLLDAQAVALERQEIVDFENSFASSSTAAAAAAAGDETINSVRITEATSQLIGQVMKFDPNGVARRPPADTIQNIRKLNVEYKLGQLLCKSRQPDFLLSLIQRQTTKQSLPWLSSLIESSSDCLEIMPIQCICEFVWNLLNPSEEEIIFKKVNPEQLLNRIKQILNSSSNQTETTTTNIGEQIGGVFKYFLEKLCSEKQSTRASSLRILNRLFLSSSGSAAVTPTTPTSLTPGDQVDVSELLVAFRRQTGVFYDSTVRELLVFYLRRLICVETNLDYLNVYVRFLIEYLGVVANVSSSSSSDVDMLNGDDKDDDDQDVNESVKTKHNEMANDLAEFFFRRDYFYSRSFAQLLVSSKDTFGRILVDYVVYMFKLNSVKKNSGSSSSKHLLLKSKKPFERNENENNVFILIDSHSTARLVYINERTFNVLVYLVLVVLDNLMTPSTGVNKIYDQLTQFEYLNCDFDTALNDLVKRKALTIDKHEESLEGKLLMHLVESVLQSKKHTIHSLLGMLMDEYGLSSIAVRSILKKLDNLVRAQSADSELAEFVRMRPHHLDLASLVEMIKSSASNTSNSLLVQKLEKLTSRPGDNSTVRNMSLSHMQIFSMESSSRPVETKTKVATIEKKSTAVDQIRRIEERIKSLAAKCNQTVSTTDVHATAKMEVDDDDDEVLASGAVVDEQKSTKRTKIERASMDLVRVISRSNSQNLEANVMRRLSRMEDEHNNDDNDATTILADSIFNYEAGTAVVDEEKKKKKTYDHMTIDALLDLYCRRDPHIVSRRLKATSTIAKNDDDDDEEDTSQFRLVFAERPQQSHSKTTDSSSNRTDLLTQSFLLALFIHQSDWSNLTACVNYLLDTRSVVFAKFNRRYRLNPTIVLNFFASLIHIPELWKGTETRVLQKYNEEPVLNLTGKQLCALLDYIIEEMYILHERVRRDQDDNDEEDNDEATKSLLNNSFKRVQLLMHFLRSKEFIPSLSIGRKKSKNKPTANPYELIVDHFKTQVDELNRLNNNNKINKKLSLSEYKQDEDDHVNMPTVEASPHVLVSLQSMVLFAIYLEDHSIIDCISNPNRLFFHFYHQVNQPTKLDLKAHNLLNCFGEVEVNYSNNATSSGVIGVAAGGGSGGGGGGGGAGFRKQQQERQELAAYVKKQEAFMMDANLVLVKLASRHPYMFIRQLAMMEGLLQGRVAYSFDEFRRRKFDKLFHYVIDILNYLVPYIFHAQFDDYVVAIVAHYFDVFMSYSSESREFIGSLGKKFVEFLDKLMQTDLKNTHSVISRKYSQFLEFFQKSYPEIYALRNLTSIEAMPFSSSSSNDTSSSLSPKSRGEESSKTYVNILNQKQEHSQVSSLQLEVFINRLNDRDNFEGIALVLQELDTLSQRDTSILTHFVFYLRPLIMDQNDIIRDFSISLLMRYLRLNPRESVLFYDAFCEALSHSNSKVFSSTLRVLSEYILLCPEKSNSLMKITTKNSVRHNIDPTKMLTDSTKMLTLEKYVY